MKRTRKFSALGDVQAVVSAAPTLEEASKRLGVNRSTLTRWLQQGKVFKTPPASSVAVPVSADGWADGVRAVFALSTTDSELLALADLALKLARDPDTSPMTALSAMGRYQALVKQLELTDAKRIDAEPVKRPSMMAAANARPRRSTGDPRAVLMAVK